MKILVVIGGLYGRSVRRARISRTESKTLRNNFKKNFPAGYLVRLETFVVEKPVYWFLFALSQHEGRTAVKINFFPYPWPFLPPVYPHHCFPVRTQPGLGPRSRLPTRTSVAPSSTACTKSWDMPMDRWGSFLPVSCSRLSRNFLSPAK